MSIQVKVEKDLALNDYQVKFSIQDVSGSDQELIDAFGEPQVQIGGTITGPSDVTTLPAAERGIPSGFPVLQTFDGDDFVDAEGLANAYITEILLRITTAMVDLRTGSDTFTGESVTTI
jgi:hypothetical protein